jgi:hypothetical protein
MTSAENKAVFLSYASQDAEAAQRLAAARRVHFRADPSLKWNSFREDPEIAALLAEPDAKAKSER